MLVAVRATGKRGYLPAFRRQLSRMQKTAKLASNLAKLAKNLRIHPSAVQEALTRGLLHFVKRRGKDCWRFGDERNGCCRRMDGLPFNIRGEPVKCLSENSGSEWHRLIGLEEVVRNDRRQVLIIAEGSKDGMAALHFAALEGTLHKIGVVVALGTGVRLLPEDVQKLSNRQVRIIGDAEPVGKETVLRLAHSLLPVAQEVQSFSLAGLWISENVRVTDLFDVTRIDRNTFDSDSGLLSITRLDEKSDRVAVIKRCFSFSSSSPPPESPVLLGHHVFPVSPVSPVSEDSDLSDRLTQLAKVNRCETLGTARTRRFKLLRDLAALELQIQRKLTPAEMTYAFDVWHSTSIAKFDPKKSRDHYLSLFFAEIGKVQVPTDTKGALGDALKKVRYLSTAELPELPGMPNAPESWRWLAALHRELSRLSAQGTYFLSSRDAVNVHSAFKKDSAYAANLALSRIGAIRIVKVGDARPGGHATEFRYLL